VLVGDLGLVTGGRVLLRGPNAPWLVACWLAGSRPAASPSPRCGASLRAALDQRDHPAVVALCDAVRRHLAEGLPDLPVVRYGDGDLEGRADRRTPFPAVATRPTTSRCCSRDLGTTGVPKTTAHFHGTLAVADTFSAHVLGRPRTTCLGSPPLTFTYGLGGELIFPFRAGAATLLVERPATT
jgi:2-aminobenzoate-CoA ligase